MSGVATSGVAVARRIYRRVVDRRRERGLRRQEERLRRFLEDPAPPSLLDAEERFDDLQRRSRPLPGYGYDSFSNWRRGVRRTEELLERFPELRSPGARVLEAGCGDAMLGAALDGAGHRVELVDLEDRRDPRAGHLPLHRVDLCTALPFEDGRFDLAASYNTFEHLDRPDRTLSELIRVVRPGGAIFLSFGPLYWSPWGLHAFETIHVPYVHLLFSEPFVTAQLRRLGIRDLGAERDSLQPLNRWPLARFEELFRTCGCRVEALERRAERRWLWPLEEHPRCLSGRRLGFDDLTVCALAVALRRDEGGSPATPPGGR